MKKNYTLFLLFAVFACSFSSAQSQSSSDAPEDLDLFRYKVEESRMFKIDLLNLIRRLDENGIIGVLNLGYEQKIGISWSFNLELLTNYLFNIQPNGNPRAFLADGSIGTTLSTRYYFDLKKRIANGRSVNNLSANYLSLSVSSRLMQMESGTSVTDNGYYFYSDNFGIAPLIGVQRRLASHIFFDFNTGVKFAYRDNIRFRPNNLLEQSEFWQLLPIANFKVGIGF